MKNIKKILIAVLSFSLLFTIGCDNEGKTGGGGNGGTGTGGSSGGSQSKSELVGTWKPKTVLPPNTVELAGTIVKLDGTDTGETKKGKCIFNSASECITTIQMHNPLERPESRWYDLTETYYKE